MGQVRGVASANSDNLITGDGVAQFQGTRYVIVHALAFPTDAPGANAGALTSPAAKLEVANGSDTMARGQIPTMSKAAQGSGQNPIVGFSESTLIFEGWITAGPKAEQVLALTELPSSNWAVYYSYEHRLQAP